MSCAKRDTLYGMPVCEDGSLLVSTGPVREEWLDHNGHMNVAPYLTAFDAAVCKMCTGLGIGPDQIPTTNKTIFVGQANIVYRQELVRGDAIRITAQIVGLTEGRVHAALSMYHAVTGALAAFNEQLFVCVDLVDRAPCWLPPLARERFGTVFDTQRHLPFPKYAGRQIRLHGPTETPEKGKA